MLNSRAIVFLFNLKYFAMQKSNETLSRGAVYLFADYQKPDIVVVEVHVQRGFAASNYPGDTEDIPTDDATDSW